MKNLFLSAVVTIALGFASCSTDDKPAVNSNNGLEFSVAKMGDYLSQVSRGDLVGDSTVGELPVLTFKDQQEFDVAVKRLKGI